MPNIPGNIDPMNTTEIAARQPITEALLNKIGANINGLIDLIGGNIQTFTANGTFNVPENIERVFVLGCGGGGGGGGGISGTIGTTWYAPGGAGGGGAPLIFTSVAVTPLAAIPVVIGAGGAGGIGGVGAATSASTNGSDGGQSSFGSVIFPGGRGGSRAMGGATSTTPVTIFGGLGAGAGGNTYYSGQTSSGAINNVNSGPPAFSNYLAFPGGGQLGAGGAAGSRAGSSGGPGGGGGGSYGTGGTGGTGGAANPTAGVAGASYGAGGGGGGSGSSGSGANGGAGYQGLVVVIW